MAGAYCFPNLFGMTFMLLVILISLWYEIISKSMNFLEFCQINTEGLIILFRPIHALVKCFQYCPMLKLVSLAHGISMILS